MLAVTKHPLAAYSAWPWIRHEQAWWGSCASSTRSTLRYRSPCPGHRRCGIGLAWPWSAASGGPLAEFTKCGNALQPCLEKRWPLAAAPALRRPLFVDVGGLCTRRRASCSSASGRSCELCLELSGSAVALSMGRRFRGRPMWESGAEGDDRNGRPRRRTFLALWHGGGVGGWRGSKSPRPRHVTAKVLRWLSGSPLLSCV